MGDTDRHIAKDVVVIAAIAQTSSSSTSASAKSSSIRKDAKGIKSERQAGTVSKIKVNRDTGDRPFAFLRADDDENRKDYFLHKDYFPDDIHFVEGAKVTFTHFINRGDKPVATDVRLVNPARPENLASLAEGIDAARDAEAPTGRSDLDQDTEIAKVNEVKSVSVGEEYEYKKDANSPWEIVSVLKVRADGMCSLQLSDSSILKKIDPVHLRPCAIAEASSASRVRKRKASQLLNDVPSVVTPIVKRKAVKTE